MLFPVTKLPEEWAVAVTLTRCDLHLKQEKGIRQQYQKRQDMRGQLNVMSLFGKNANFMCVILIYVMAEEN